MEKIIWRSSFSVGNVILDEQHKQIITFINQLIENYQVETNSDVLSDLMLSVTNYAEMHFLTEERLLRNVKYPKLEEQIEDHNKYRYEIANLCLDIMDAKGSVSLDLLVYLRDWWLNHILVEDMRFKLFFQTPII